MSPFQALFVTHYTYTVTIFSRYLINTNEESTMAVRSGDLPSLLMVILRAIRVIVPLPPFPTHPTPDFVISHQIDLEVHREVVDRLTFHYFLPIVVNPKMGT